MKYLILIHHNRDARAQFAALPEEARAAGLQAYDDLNAELAASGELISAEALADDSTATVVSLRSGAVVTSDGPFAESKEMLAGFYLVDVESVDRAVEIAAKLPEVSAGAGDVEIRPVMGLSAMA